MSAVWYTSGLVLYACLVHEQMWMLYALVSLRMFVYGDPEPALDYDAPYGGLSDVQFLDPSPSPVSDSGRSLWHPASVASDTPRSLCAESSYMYEDLVTQLSGHHDSLPDA